MLRPHARIANIMAIAPSAAAEMAGAVAAASDVKGGVHAKTLAAPFDTLQPRALDEVCDAPVQAAEEE